MNTEFRDEINKYRDYLRLQSSYKRQLQKIKQDQRRAEWEARAGPRSQPARGPRLAQAGPRSPAPSLASNTGAHLHTHKRLHARTHGRSGSPCADLSGIPPAPAHAESLPSGIPPAPAHAEPLPSGLIAEWPRPAETGRDSRSAAARPACGPSTPGRLAQGD